jgi:hypothetical protein
MNEVFRNQATWEMADWPSQTEGWECGLLLIEGLRRTLVDNTLNGVYRAVSWDVTGGNDSKSKPQLHGGSLSLTERVRNVIDSNPQFRELKEAFANREKDREKDRDVWDLNKKEWAEQVNAAMRLIVETLRS